MKKAYFTSFVTILLLTFISVAYAAFSSDLKITGEASVLKDTVPPTCGSWYLRDSSLTTQEAFDQNKFINAGTNTTWTNTNKTLFIECSDNLDGDYGCINVDTVTTSAGGKRYFKDVKNYTTSIKTDGNAVTVTLKDAYQNEKTCTLPVGGSNPYIDKQGPSITISRTAANKFTYSATDDMSSVVTTQYMVTTSSTQPSINDSGWSSTASEVTIDQTAAKTYYVWAKDGVNITHKTISTYKLTKTQGTGTTLTLKYNNNSGAELNTSYVLAGTPVYVTASANNGYGSLVLKKDSTSISSGSTQTISGATTISSSATPNTYTITYDANGGTGAPAPQDFTFNAGESISTTVPTRTGYTFINWKYGSTTFNPGDTIPSGWGSFTLTAQWSAKTYTLNLNKNDGTGAGTTSLTATYNLSTISQSSMTLASKSFTISGFGTAAARKSDGATVSSTSTLTSTATLNGYYTASTGGSLILAANTTPTFNTGSVSGYLSSGTWVRDANTTLYAQFGTMPSKTLPTITKTGYTCGWTTSESGTSIQYQSGGSLIPTGNTTLYGVCVPASYTIAYTMNNGNDPSPKPTSGTYNSDVTIGTTSVPSKTVTIAGNANSTGATVGSATINTQVFAGWSSSSGAGLGSGAKTGTSASPSTSWNGSATTNKYYKNLRDTSGTVTLTANWGGSSTLPTVTKTGYTCGWYDTNGTSGGNYIGASGGSYTVPSGSSTAITVYARCAPNVYTITLNQQSGSGGTGTIYERYDDGYYLTYSSGAVSNKMSTSANGVTVPTRTGYTFGGYYTSTGGAGTQYIDANGKLTSSASASQFSSSTNTLYAKWTINQYTVTCKDYFVDSSNNLKVLLGSSTKSLDYGSSVSGATWGTTTTTSTYYSAYSYHGSSAATTVPANNDLVVYRYFYAWTDLNIYYASGSSQSGATVEFKVGSGSWADVTNESNTIQPWGTTYYVRNIRPKNATEEFSHVNANLVWDSTNQYYSYTPTAAGTSMNIYMKYKVYTIALDKQSGSGGTGTIYEKYNTGYYTDSSATTQMTTSANPVSVPTRTGYTFGGYYTSTGGAGTQFIDANGKLTSSASTTQFSANGSLYAHWTPITYTIAYTMNNGNDPSPKPTSGTYDSNVSIGTTSIPSKTVTITGNANGTGASVGAATVNALTFTGWSSSSGAGLQGNAQSGSTTSNFASWTGGTTTNKYFKNLRNGSGTVTLTANWSTTVTLPTLSKTGHTCSWTDANGNAFGTTISQNASTSITVYAQCTANTYNITLNHQGGSGGTGTIYEKYSDGYYLTNTSGTVSNKMSTSANPVTIPTKSGYTFGGYYTSTNGGGTQYIDANGKLTSSASSTQFSSAGNLYAKWNLNTPATPTISGGATKVYGSSSTTLTCSNSTTYPSGITKKYQFGYASSDGGSPGNWTTESDSNTLTIAANAYVEQRWYSCRVRVYDGSAYSGYATSSTSADTEMTINNATLTFDANNGTGGGTVYTKTGQNVVYNGIRSTSTTSIPTASRAGYTFLGWYDAPSGGNKVLNADGSFTGTAVSGYTSTNTWVATTNKTLYAYWNGITYTITFHYGDTQKYDIPYTSSNTYQTVTIPTTGKYRLEAWGAQGGDSVNDGGSSHSAGAKGAYTSGVAPFNADDTLYVYVGQHPGYVSSGKANNPGGWNGGGTGSRDYGDNDSAGGGGGATDFRFFDDDVTVNSTILTWDNAVGLRYRIMVAAGGGGNAWTSNPGHGGALSSSPHGVNLKYATQTSGYAFGKGGSGTAYTKETKVGNAGGGGGYWGGYAGEARNTSASGLSSGGSSYISGHTGAVAVINNAYNTPRYASDGTTLCANGTTDNTCSIHFTNKVFEDTVMISGDSAPSAVVGTDEELDYMMKEPDGNEVYGHAGHGYARVSLDSVQKQVTSGQVIGSVPLPYNSNTYWAIYDDEGEDEEGNPIHTYYNVEYDINWAYKGFMEREDGEGNSIDYEEDVPIDLNETYDPFYGTDFYAYGTPHEYSITYIGVSEAQWTSGSGAGAHYIEHPSHYNSLDELTIPNPVNGIYSGTYYKFTGWTGTDLLTNTKDLTIEKGDAGDKVYTANWETKSTFSVTYNANGGTTTCPTTSGQYGVSWELCDDGATYGNVKFLGWYTKPSGGEYMGDGTVAYQYLYGYGDNEGDYILYAHWDIDAIEYDYNISQSFAANRMINTYYAPDWTKTFEVEIKFSISTASKRYFLFGNYDNSATNALNLEVAQNNTIRVYVGKGSTNTTFGSVSTNQEITVKALWNGTTQKLTVDVSGGGTGHYEGTLTALANISGKTNRHFRFGASDYRASTTPFNSINVKDFVIREFYGPPLQDSITVPDPAGHYLLFEGWTGPNGDTPQYNLTVPTNSEGLISYKANWSTGVSFKAYSKTFSTSNQYIKFKNEVTVVYIDQAKRRAYTRERVYFYRTNTGYNTYGQGSMKVKYNWSASSQTWTVDLAGKKINENGINLWSENWNAYSISYRSIPYTDAGTRSVTLGVTSFTHAIFSVSTPKNASFTLPAIKPLE